MSRFISCQETMALMASDRLFALFDVRERGEYNECQISGATSLPRSQIELRIAQLVPERGVPVVVYDDLDGRASFAAATVAELGYGEFAILRGGLKGWRDAGGPTVSGVNVPSKIFGEKIYHERNIPDISGEELIRLKRDCQDLRILDMRTPEEYGRFCIPGGINVPGGDLILWAEELRRSNATVIVNCAGRTRSIIGAAALRRLGLKNVRALKNGTMGWVLDGFTLETNPAGKRSLAPPESRAPALALALEVAQQESLAWISPEELSETSIRDRMSYLIDVRSGEEYETGHMPGSISVPGGQAVQRADDFVAVRNAPIIFLSDDSARAVMAAYWYRQMGFPHVFILRGGLRAWTESGGRLVSGSDEAEPLGLRVAKQQVQWIAPQELRQRLRDSSLSVIDLSTSIEFEAAHVPSAQWISRGWIEIEIPKRFADRNRQFVLSCTDGVQSIFAARALSRIGYLHVCALSGGVRAWSSAGLPTESGLDACLVRPDDVVLSPSIRGDKKAMQQYLDWELKLVR